MSLSSLQSVIIGGATTIIDYSLKPNKVVVSYDDGKISTSLVSNIVGYLVGTNDLIQTQLNSKANQSTTYSKTEVDNRLVLKANQSTTYSKIEVDSNLALNANQATTYSKTEVDSNLALKQIEQQQLRKLQLMVI